MFEPPIFEETRVPVMHDLMQAHPFATVISTLDDLLNADHLPFVLYRDEGGMGVLRGHVAVANPLWRAHKDGTLGADVLIVFQGPQTYVSPSWYASKQEHGKVVPTWNYAVVHARGALTFHPDPTWLIRQLNDLTNAHEGQRPDPWAVNDAPQAFIERQMKGIVGVEVAITELTGKWKMSQNKSDADRAGVVKGLSDDEKPTLAQLVRGDRD